MATKQTGGIAHLTVVPENFEPDAEQGRDAGSTGDSDRARDE